MFLSPAISRDIEAVRIFSFLSAGVTLIEYPESIVEINMSVSKEENTSEEANTWDSDDFQVPDLDFDQ